MNKRRVIYYSDARHYHMYIYDPPIQLEAAYAPVDAAAGAPAARLAARAVFANFFVELRKYLAPFFVQRFWRMHRSWGRRGIFPLRPGRSDRLCWGKLYRA